MYRVSFGVITIHIMEIADLLRETVIRPLTGFVGTLRVFVRETSEAGRCASDCLPVGRGMTKFRKCLGTHNNVHFRDHQDDSASSFTGQNCVQYVHVTI